MPRSIRSFLAVALSWVACAAQADTLYATSVRNPAGNSAHLVPGNLYTVDVATGVFTLVGAPKVGGTEPIGVTGLADHPTTGVLYGITAEASLNHPRSLVTLDAATATATLVGPLGASGSDIAFDPAGVLFVWLPATGQLGSIDLGTGKATPLGSPGPATQTGGLAIGADGRAYLAASGASGTLDVVDTRSGAITKGPVLSGAPYPAGINSLTISPDGTLYAVNTNLGSPANTMLVKIDVVTGVVRQVGPLPNNTEALMFASGPSPVASYLSSRAGLTMVAAVIAVGLVIALLLFMRRKR